MRGFFLAVIALGLVWFAALSPMLAATRQPAGMTSFKSEQELKTFLKARRMANRRSGGSSSMNDYAIPAPPAPPPSPSPMVAPPVPAESAPAPAPASVAPAKTSSDSAASPNITNRQEADVDEGGIVKVHGDHLVILRRGRLFTVSVADKAMKPIAHIDAFPPMTSGQGAWYDEMLISGDRVIVIGYSYARGGTEVSRFKISASGHLSYEDTHHLRSDDYYSSRNYASRMIGSKLIFYTPLSFYEDDYASHLPGIKRWTGKTDGRFVRTAPSTRIYMAEPVRRRLDADISTLHSVTICDLAAAALDCKSTGVLGSYSRNFYVSGKAVYVWVDEAFYDAKGRSAAMLYRMPLDGSRPSAIQTRGGPVDQFSFREDRAQGVLNIVVRAQGRGEAMWEPEVSAGQPALLRLPLSIFGNGAQRAANHRYRSLPKVEGWSFQNRYVGGHLLYSGGVMQRSNAAKVFVVPVAGGAISTINAPHGVDRIEQMGVDAVVVGGGRDNALGFSAIELSASPKLGDTFRLPAASEGETRSHAYFYRSDSADGSSGLLGLPISKRLDPSFARFLGNGSAITFLGRTNRRFAPAGELEAKGVNARDDGCQASCVDWYGNARPIFLGDRVFALMGYELVEGRLADGRIGEVGRADFAPSMRRD
jgi:Beta propeller domain